MSEGRSFRGREGGREGARDGISNEVAVDAAEAAAKHKERDGRCIAIQSQKSAPKLETSLLGCVKKEKKSGQVKPEIP